MYEIFDGLKRGVDVSVYIDPWYNSDQMKEIKFGLSEGVDVSQYANPSISAKEMEVKRKSLRREKHESDSKGSGFKLSSIFGK